MELPRADYAEKFRKPTGPRNEWELTLDTFFERINTPASIKKFGVFSRARIGKALKGKSSLEIAQLFAECKKARSFGGLFGHLTKITKKV